ncbi:DUF4175 family protein [Lutimonas zeaxanthinifaciens]|uniref:DUF4175 family protein n=1 Tax=Lutimonas zeaxanthinifaciens TaxID=3060215 RepID=UPI00265CC228|nr:DUF4175 family protein [Lutimonas sp. YSD2104]WKK66036.1 hypothetical protein QZH61_00075 [Lutimonas sp. YSD2104]
MEHFQNIHDKLKAFIRKYYTNEIIKGGIFFLAFGFLYLLLTLAVEHYFWLEPIARTVLFWLFIGIEFYFLFRFILIPVMKLIGIRKGISNQEASKIIGAHFSEVEDKLLNIIQLNASDSKNELLSASIEQKSKELRPIKFRRAIVFKNNVSYLKYLLIPVMIWFIVWITGNNSVFTKSLNRVVHHQTAFEPPAPFRFIILNDSLETVQDQSYELKYTTEGEIVPENSRVIIGDNSFYALPDEDGNMMFTFEIPQNDIEFRLQGGSVRSRTYKLKVLSAPKITEFIMVLKYPDYLNKPTDTIRNTGNASIPVGTKVNWIIGSQNAETIDLEVKGFKKELVLEGVKTGNSFSFSREVLQSLTYEVRSSNQDLKDYEVLSYELGVVKDEFPKINVQSDIDSVSRGPVQFRGQLTDDYGISRVQIVAKDLQNGKLSQGQINTGNSDFEEFFYVFPQGILLEEGHSYELYFEVFDNDRIKGPKKVKSRSFTYRYMTQEEEEEEILQEQIEGINKMEDSRESGQKLEKSLDEFSKKLKNKEETDWNDKKELKDFLERQKSYDQMLEKNAEKMKDNLEEINPDDDESLKEKQEELKNRWEEVSDYKEKEELIKELEELAEKLEKEDLLEKIDKLKEQSKQEKRSLERILELTKQFYVEKKSAQIMNKLNELSEEQLDLSTEERNSKKEQEKLNEKFDSIRRDFEELRKQNEDLKNPMDIFDSEPDEKLINMDMENAQELLEKSEGGDEQDQKNNLNKAKNKQRQASRRMEELSKKMESGLMEMEMQGVQENIEDLQQILKNLLLFSMDQEDLMLSFDQVDARSADFPKKLKEQIKLKEHFEHIDDSLYALSLRMVELSSKIQEDLSNVHYNLDKSLENIAENRIQQGMSNQQYTMTSANNLADLLSDMLQSLQNQKPGSGKGKGKEGEMNLPDIIKQQQEIMKKMEDGMQGKEGQGQKGKEAMSGEQFQLFQEQKMLREQLQELLDREGSGNREGKKALDQMEELEKILLERGITKETLERMQELEHELLELENADLTRNKDKKRESETNRLNESEREIKALEDLYKKGSEDEQLKRNRLELSPDYKAKVKKYFDQEIK